MGINPDTDVGQLTFVSYRTPKGAIRDLAWPPANSNSKS